MRPTTNIDGKTALPVDIKRLLSKPAPPTVYTASTVARTPNNITTCPTVPTTPPTVTTTLVQDDTTTSAQDQTLVVPKIMVLVDKPLPDLPPPSPIEFQSIVPTTPPTPPPPPSLAPHGGTIIAVGSPRDYLHLSNLGSPFDGLGLDSWDTPQKGKDKDADTKHPRLIRSPLGPRTLALSKKISGTWKKVTGGDRERHSEAGSSGTTNGIYHHPPLPTTTNTTTNTNTNTSHISIPSSLRERRTTATTTTTVMTTTTTTLTSTTTAAVDATPASRRHWRRSSLTLSLRDTSYLDTDLNFNDGAKSLPSLLTRPTTTTPRRAAHPTARVRTGPAAPRRAQSELISSGRIWRLMKKISAGRLRERFEHGGHDHDQNGRGASTVLSSSPPPMPALPDTAKKQGGVISRLLSTRKGRPVAPTRSPSPGSDVASSKFFYRHSTRSSSSSSYGDDPNSRRHSRHSVPLIDQHIVPPEQLQVELSAGDAADEGVGALSEVGHRPDSERVPSLPFPPRRRATTGSRGAAAGGKKKERKSLSLESPLIPLFATVGAINTFGQRRRKVYDVNVEGVGEGEGEGDGHNPIPDSAFGPTGFEDSPPSRRARPEKRLTGGAFLRAFAFGGSKSASNVDPRFAAAAADADADADEGRSRSRASTLDARPRSSSVASTVRPARQRSTSLGSISGFRRRRKGGPPPLVPVPVPVPTLTPTSTPMPMSSPLRTPSSSPLPSSMSVPSLTTVLSPLASPLPHASRSSRSPGSAGLTDQEKAEKWDDLLERSARAGGTLRVRTSVLVSDLVRLSSASEISVDLDSYS
jgi:hypothetical protein